jgi:rod shape-determining protein MreD
MRWLRFAFVIVLATFIQASGLPDFVAITRTGAKPDFLLILLVFFALHCYGYEAVITSFAIGLAADIASSALGPCLISFGLCGVLLNGLRQVIVIRRTMHVVGAVAVTGFAVELLSQLLGLIKGQGWPPNAFSQFFGTAVYSGLLAPYVFSGLLAMVDWLGIKKYHFTR